MKKQGFLFLLLLASSQLAFAACTSAACKEASAQYASDKKLCAEEKTSSIRMQCLRDAKAEYTRALGQASPSKTSAKVCEDCGKVLRVSMVEKQGEGSALGIIGGGIAGALLGNQIGKGSGKTVATVAGAAGGAYAGHQVEAHMKTSNVWSVQVQMENGTERVFEFSQDPGLNTGDLVRLSGDSITRR